MTELSEMKKVYENPVYGDKFFFSKRSSETNGELTLIEFEIVPGGGNEPHSHLNYAETFRVIEGELTVKCNHQEYVLKKGDSFTVPEGAVHFFKNKSKHVAKFEVAFRPGQPDFEKVLMIAYGLARDGRTRAKGFPKKFSHLALLLVMANVRIPGVGARLFMPIFRWSAARAIRRGEWKELEATYCQ
jgi:quercetin dioxygenase-like cupin family protein